MRDYLSNRGGSSSVRVSDFDEGKAENSVVWTSDRIAKILKDHEEGLIDIKTLKNSPFKDNDPDWKKPNIVFEYKPEEMAELRKCREDIVYFAENYCMIMTEHGVKTVTLYDYQREVVNTYKEHNRVISMQSRQSGKTWMSSIFIAWYTIFHYDKNTLAIADNAATTKEVIDKIKTIFQNLPFWLKPGCVTNAVMTMKFDNGCRIIGRSTTKKAGIGFNIHLLYIDEFAHINETYLDHFFRSIYPTISASKTSKLLITSTPNGQNKFFQIYQDAVDGKSGFKPLRVDWWQTPGRDEEWRKAVIAELGSEQDFNQEYGLQFFSSDKLLLHAKELKKMAKLKTSYIKPSYNIDIDKQIMMEHFMVHPNFSRLSASDIKNDPNYYVFSIDTADGLGKDHLVINIFKFAPLPVKMLLPVKNFIKDRPDIFGLVQVATYRTNEVNINEFCNALEFITFGLFNPEKVRLVIELNHKGEYVLSKLESNPQYSPSMIIHSKHTIMSEHYKPGIRLSSGEMKKKICERFKYTMTLNKIMPNEFKTISELGAFGMTKAGTYRSQSGNDDLAITCVNASSFFESPNFWELANDVLDDMDKSYDPKTKTYLKELKVKIFTAEDDALNAAAEKRGLDLAALADLNRTSVIKDPKQIDRVFSEEGISGYRQRVEQFRTGRGPDTPRELSQAEIDEYLNMWKQLPRND